MERRDKSSDRSTMQRPAFAAAAFLVGSLALAGCGADTGETSPEEAAAAVATPVALNGLADELDDAVLGLRVRMRLLEHLHSDALGVSLAIDDGAVVLSGTVEEASSKSLAREVALSVDGVQDVSNRIRVVNPEREDQPPVSRAVGVAERELADALLLTRLKLRLARELGARALDIDVDVRDGVVSLRGTLPDADSRRYAVATAASVDGVESVHDLLDVARP
jgi:hyperosmotically inducible periplasmic protein